MLLNCFHSEWLLNQLILKSSDDRRVWVGLVKLCVAHQICLLLMAALKITFLWSKILMEVECRLVREAC